jgi:ABC-type lipoprotein release transport system permease subunit
MFVLAWRNLWRHRRRSIITLSAVAVVVTLSLIYYGFGGASMNSMYQNLTENSGQIQVHTPDYRDQREFDLLLIRDAEAVRETLLASGEGGEVVGVLEVPTLLAGEDRSRGIVMIGQDWTPGVLSRRIDPFLSDGRFLAEDELDGVVLGAALARALEVGIGDEVFAYAPGTEGYGAGAYTVVGTVDLLDAAFEARAAFLTLPAAQELAAPGAVSRFELHYPELVRVDQDVQTPVIRDQLQAELPLLSVEGWRDLNPGLVRLLDLLGPLMAFVNGIFFLLAGLLVVNTIYLSLMERIHEFGVIISLGANGRKVMGMITLESVLLCVTGALVGMGIGLTWIAFLSRGVRFPGLDEYYASFGLNPVFYLSITPTQALFSFSFAIIIGVLAALWPASVAARLEPVEAMRFTA